MRRRTYAQADSNRREFLEAAAAITALPVLGSRVHGVVRRRLAFADDPFSLGVTSGDPAPDGFVIQTRLAPATGAQRSRRDAWARTGPLVLVPVYRR